MKFLFLVLLAAAPSFGAIGLTPSTLTFHWTQGGQVRDFSQNVSVTGSGSFTVTQVSSSCTTAGITYIATPSSGTATATVAISVISTTFTPAIGTLSCTLQFDTGVNLTIDVVVQRPLQPAPYLVTMNHELATASACVLDGQLWAGKCDSPSNAPAPGYSGSMDFSAGAVNTDPLLGGDLTTISASQKLGAGHFEQHSVSVDGNWATVGTIGGGYDIIQTVTPFTEYHKTDANFSSSCSWVSKTGNEHRIICNPDNSANIYEFLFDDTDGSMSSSTVFTSAYTLWNGGTQHATGDVWVSGQTITDSRVVLVDVDGAAEYSYVLETELDCTNCIDYTQAVGPDANGCHYLIVAIPAASSPVAMDGVPNRRSKVFKHCPGDGATLTKVSDGWGNISYAAAYPVIYLDPTENLYSLNTANVNVGFGHGSVALVGTTPVMVGRGDNGIFAGINEPASRTNGAYGQLDKGDNTALPLEQGGGYDAWRRVPWAGDMPCSATGNGICLVTLNAETSGNLQSHVISSMTTGASTVLTFADDPGWAMGDEIRIGMVQGVTGLNGLVHTVTAATGAVVTISTSTSGTYTASTGLAIENIPWSLENQFSRGLAWVRIATGQAILATKGWSVTTGPTTAYSPSDIAYWQSPHTSCNRDCSKAVFVTNGGYPQYGYPVALDSPFADVDENTASYEFDKNGHGIYATPTADGATVDVIVPSGSLSCSFDYSLYTDLSSPTNSTGTAAQTWSFTLSGLAASTTYYFRGSCDNFYYGIGSFTTATPGAAVIQGNATIQGNVVIQ